jgi:hypothetical protein
MGTILREKLNKLADLTQAKMAYKAVFSTDAEAIFIDPAVKDSLEILEEMRHLFTHRAGRVDSTVSDAAQRLKFSAPAIGEDLFVDGAEVSRLIDAAVIFAQNLITFVDQRLTKQRPK